MVRLTVLRNAAVGGVGTDGARSRITRGVAQRPAGGDWCENLHQHRRVAHHFDIDADGETGQRQGRGRDDRAEHPERDARFFTRLGWALAIIGAGSFFTWASLAPLLLISQIGLLAAPALLLAWIAGFTVVILYPETKFPRYSLPIAPALAICAGVAIVALTLYLRARMGKAVSVSTATLILLLLLGRQRARRPSGSLATPLNGVPSDLTSMNSPAVLLSGSRSLLVQSPVTGFLTWVRSPTDPMR